MDYNFIDDDKQFGNGLVLGYIIGLITSSLVWYFII